MKRAAISKLLLVMMFFLLVSSAINVNAQPVLSSDDTEDEDDTTTDDEQENQEDDEYEPDTERDDDGTVWIQTDVMTVRLNPGLPVYQYWYTPDENGSLARFQVSYLMVIEFEDQNGDGVYQINETVQFVPLEAFDWTLKTGVITDSEGRNSEVYATYAKGGISSEDWDDDWFKDWIPNYEEYNDNYLLSDDDDEEDDDDESDIFDLERFKQMTLQFYAHIYMEDYDGEVRDDEGLQANYTISGGIELKIDIEIGNFPYLSNTSKVAVLNYLQEDVATNGENHYFELHEDDNHDEDIESEDEWEINDDLGEKFDDVDSDDDGEDDDIQEISLIEATTNTTRGFYRWVDKAIQTLPDGSKTAVDVDASYWADGNALLLFLAYPHFDGGSILHDPSMKFVETSSPIPIIPGGVLEVPLEITAGAVILTIATIAIIAIVLKRR